MSDYGRLSRRDRLRLSGKRRVQFALALAFALLILIVIRNWWPQLKELIAPQDYGQIQAIADSLVVQAGSSFSLNDTIFVDSLLKWNNPRGEDYSLSQYRQPWPSILPFEFYVERLQELCLKRHLDCNCEESDENSLFCRIGSRGFNAAVVMVRRSAGTRLNGRRVAFLIRNLGAMDNNQIMQMAENGVTFSYLATPDVYPSARIRNALEKAGVTSILEVPTEISNLADLQERTSGNRGRTDTRGDRELAAGLFDRHPGPGAVMIRRTGSVDSSFVKSVIEEAKTRGAAYIYDSDSPDAIDSLAYSSGLVILTMKNVADFSIGRFNHDRSALLRELILSFGSNQRTIAFDGSDINVDDLLGLQRSFRRLGVNIMNSISLMEKRESL